MTRSAIEWTQMTWNPTTGCTKISPGCKHCYAEVMSRRLKAMGVTKYHYGFNKIRTHKAALHIPYHWHKPRVIFVNSMSDLFHADVSDSFIKKVFQVMNENQQHTFQVLTKRAERLLQLNHQLHWSSNIWMGVSIENRATMRRISFLKRTSAKIKFLSCEPLLESLPRLPLKNIDWVIVGGESGHKSRDMEQAWVLNIQKQCRKNNVAFFFKQWGGKNKKKNGRLLNGKTYDEMPSISAEAVSAISVP